MRKRRDHDLAEQLFCEMRFVVVDIERVQRELREHADRVQALALEAKDDLTKHAHLSYARGLRDAAARFDGPRDYLSRWGPKLHGPPRLVVDNKESKKKRPL
jgi:hypothetical protein